MSAFLSAFAGSHIGKNTFLALIVAHQGIHTMRHRHHIARCDAAGRSAATNVLRQHLKSTFLHDMLSYTSQINHHGVAGACWVAQAHECCCWWCSSALCVAVCCQPCTGRPVFPEQQASIARDEGLFKLSKHTNHAQLQLCAILHLAANGHGQLFWCLCHIS